MLRHALTGRIEPVRVTLAYRTGLLLVAIATVLLPVAYLGIAALAGWGVALHAMHNHWIIWGSGRGILGLGIIRGMAYVGPIVAGVVVVLFLFKPLLARPASRRSDLEIDASDFPLVFAMVEGICRAVSAPTPSRITVDCQVNASASFRRGLASFLGQDLQLTIGLPLATSLTLRQLAGVLGHEMGHFAQGSGMRLTYLVRSVNGWLARAVYERDAWDETLTELSNRSDWRVAIVVWVARLGVWLSRRVLWVLMIAGHAIGTLMLRQMEYDADRYEARLAGSGTFASTALAMRVLTVSSMKATSALAHSYSERRLTNDFPALVAATMASLPDDVRHGIEELEGARRRPGVFDTHPPDAARIERARAERAAGIFQLEHPAALLFGDLSGLCRRATEVFYREQHQINLAGMKLEPALAILARQDAVERDQKAYDRLFAGLVSVTRPLPLGEELKPPAAEVADVVQTLRESRETLGRLADAIRSSGKTILEAQARAMELSGAQVVLAAGFQPAGVGSGIGVDNPRAAERARRLALEKKQAAEAAQAPARAALRARVHAALGLLGAPDVRASLPGDASAQTAAGLLRALAVLGRQAPILAEMMRDHETIAALLSVNVSDDDAAQRRFKHTSSKLQALHKRMDPVLRALEAVPYPFEHAGGSVTLAAFFTDDMPPYETEFSAFLQAGHILARVHDFHARALGRLAVIVEDVERAVGLTPLDLSSDTPPTV